MHVTRGQRRPKTVALRQATHSASLFEQAAFTVRLTCFFFRLVLSFHSYPGFPNGFFLSRWAH
jgi:hypothetical protein